MSIEVYKMVEQQWLSIVEYARTFSISDMTIRRRIKTGKLPAVLKNGKYYISVSIDENGIPYRESKQTISASGPMEVMPRSQQPRYPENRNIPGIHKPMSPSINNQVESFIVKKTAQNPNVQNQPEKYIPQTHTNNPQISKPALDLPDAKMIPTSIWRPVAEKGSVFTESKALLSFCETALNKISDTEKRLENEYKEKISALEAKLATKDFEINQLRQQIDDLQLLAKILERKKT